MLDRKVVEAIKTYRENHRFMKGLFAHLGFKSKMIHFKRKSRIAGKSKFNYWKLISFAMKGITGYSTLLLRIWIFLGTIVALFALGYGLFIVIKTLRLGIDVPGYASLMCAILFLGGIQLISIGVLGDYLSRLFIESKQRPLYLIQSKIGFN